MNYALAARISIRLVELRCPAEFMEKVGESFIQPRKIARLNPFRQTAIHRWRGFSIIFGLHSDQTARASDTTLSPTIRPCMIEIT